VIASYPVSEEDSRWKKTLIGLTPEQHEWLRNKSFDGRISIAAIIRALVDQARASDAKGQKREELQK